MASKKPAKKPKPPNRPTPPPRLMFSRSSKDKQGRDGSLATVTTRGAYPKQYVFATHGLSAEKVAEAVLAIEERHAAKEEKIDGLRAAYGREFVVDGTRYKVTDAIIRDRGDDAEIVIQISELGAGGWKRMDGMPIRRVVGPISAVPDADGAEAIARGHVEAAVARELQVTTMASSVLRLLGEK